MTTAIDWQSCDVSDCNDGTWRAAVKRLGVMLVRYGESDDVAFDKLADLIVELDANNNVRTVNPRRHINVSKTVKV